MSYTHYVVRRQHENEWQDSCICGWRSTWRLQKGTSLTHPHLVTTYSRTDLRPVRSVA